jgi:very-short-patch-repair endonuclease
MRCKVANHDELIAGIATPQHGVVSRQPLLAVGISKGGIDRRVHAGRLHRLHRGVYAVGHAADSWQRRWMAAVLACGDEAALSHLSAAALWKLLRPEGGAVEVSTSSQNGRTKRRGIRLHRCSSLLLDGTTTRRFNIPVTTPARTIDDLRHVVPPRLWRRAVRQAELAGFALGPEVETDGTRSDLELDFLRICRRAGLPRPEVNVKVGRWTVDFLWRAERLAVETDSYRYHRGRIAFQDDHARELDLHARGFEMRRFDELQIEEQPDRVAADLVAALTERHRRDAAAAS